MKIENQDKKYQINYYCVSHIGKRRKIQQDNFICNQQMLPCDYEGTKEIIQGVVNTCSFPVFGVFDGLGGEEKGEVASYIAAKQFSDASYGDHSMETLRHTCHKINDEICNYIAEHGLRAMGTTAALLLFEQEIITLCNVGDTKIIRFRSGQWQQLSMDHVFSFSLGRKPDLYQCLGMTDEDIEIDPFLSQFACECGDCYLICSDGLTDMLSMEQMNELLNTQHGEHAAKSLLQMALDTPASDNITFILLYISVTG